MNKILSWNKEYYKEGGTWWCVDTDKEVDWLSSISCGECAYSGEEDDGNFDGDPDYGIECIWRREDTNDHGHWFTELYVCNKCNQLYVDHWRKGDGHGSFTDGWWNKIENETDLKYVFGITG